MSFIAQRLGYFDSSDFRDAVRKQSELADPIDLSIGIPEELTPEHVKAAGIRAIQEDKTTYTPANGLLELRQALAEKLKNENGINCSANNVTIVPGLTTGQLLVYLAVLDPGDEVIVFDPYYPPYPHLASMVGAEVIYVSTLPTFQPDIAAIEASITNKTKLIVINTPNNPSGAVYSEEDLRKIAAIAEANNILLISDEIYEHFVYDGKHFSIGSVYPNTITMNGFSKEHAMTGWRVGYVTGPQEIIDAINELQQYVVMSSSSIAQHAALAALQHRPAENLVHKYQMKRDLVVRGLSAAGYQVHGAQGAFYAFVKAPHNMTDIEFVERATEQGLVVVPGRAFSKLHGYFRISYGADEHTLERGLDVIRRITQET
ncbi:MAG TPA: aminotransferase class I/II-fold pyridoxal phosphate-dependent enzyme [Candidatus Saccharimonadales bacterium]|nr:aminotransferase class I/II-fold pyridoxal phosphate-dependent enzyme [Candidatus Saccharimonadales bacterium]